MQPGGLTPAGWVSESDQFQVLRVAAGPITAAAAAAAGPSLWLPRDPTPGRQQRAARPSPDRCSCANHVTPEIQCEGSRLATGLTLTRPPERNVVFFVVPLSPPISIWNSFLLG